LTRCDATATAAAATAAAAALGQILVRNHYAGVNASDINYTAGKYTRQYKLPHTRRRTRTIILRREADG
jgi:NADPH:quinone reductase-like Zn-dependent oxidoreductase